jgi:hypothetical protein
VSRHPILLPLLGAGLFAAAVSDLVLDFGLFHPVTATVLSALGLVSLVYFLRVTSGPRRWAPLALLLGASLALGLRALGAERAPFGRSASSFPEIRDREARERAAGTKERFRDPMRAAHPAYRSSIVRFVRSPGPERTARSIVSSRAGAAFRDRRSR